MNIKECPVCKTMFVPNRSRQFLCSVECRSIYTMGKNPKKGRNGRRKSTYKVKVDKDGYLRRYAPDHPFANGRKEIQVHVIVMEQYIGRRLFPSECVHHKNEIKTDNRIENLELQQRGAHSSLHRKHDVQYRKRDTHGRFL